MSDSSQITMPAVFDDQWKIWIWTNVGRGCNKDDIFKILLEKGFEYDDICREPGYVPSADVSLMADPFAKADPKAVPNEFPNAVRIESEELEIYTIPEYLTEDECDHLIEVIRSDLKPSTVLNPTEDDPYFRTSKTNMGGLELDALGSEIGMRICRYMGINPTFTEPMQGQYYEPGEVFKPHMDWFSDESEGLVYGKSKYNQRTWTFMVYLNDVESGGETEFVNIGHAFEPKRGDAVFWKNLKPTGEGNEFAKHCSRPFDSGFKAVTTKWFRSHGDGEPKYPTSQRVFARFRSGWI